jgi:hypothetical protein
MMMAEGRFFEDDNDPDFATLVRRLQQSYPAAVEAANKKRHHPQCSKECQPRSEASLIHDGLLKGPPISSNVYYCMYGSLHICSKTRCEYYAAQQDQTCHVSGIQHGTIVSSYDANDYRTWKPQIPAASSTMIEPATKKPKVKKTRATAAGHFLTQRVETIVMDLLFSSIRTQRNLAATANYRKIAQKARQAYAYERKTRHKQLPYLSELHKRSACAIQSALPLSELAFDPSMVAYYVAVIRQLWEKLCTHIAFDHRIDQETVALGVLYMMRQPYVHDGRVILAEDEFLRNHLPRISDMVFFGYDRDKITEGMSMLLKLYSTSNLAPESLMLDVSRLPERNASNKLYIKL